MPEHITVYQSTAGLNTVVDPERLSAGGDAPGVDIELAEAVNIEIDERGLIELRHGDVLLQSGHFHSLFCDGGDCFVVQEREKDAAIMQVAEDGTMAGVRSGLNRKLRMAWCQVNDDTFYSNGLQCGYIHNGQSYPWKVTKYQGPDVDLHFEHKIPQASHIAFRPGGQMLLAQGRAIWINHLPFQFGLYCKAMGYIGFDSDITMLAVVRDGFFASDERRTWFFRKLDTGWYHFQQTLTDNSPALLGSLANNRIALVDIGFEGAGFGRVWATTSGLCVGTDDGTVINTTKNHVVYPQGYTTGTCLINKYTILHSAR